MSSVTADNFEDFSKSNDVVVIGHFSSKDEQSYKTLTNIAEAMRDDFTFGVSFDEVLAKARNIPVSSIAMYKVFDDEISIIKSTLDSQTIVHFLRAAGRPPVVEFLPELHDGYFEVRELLQGLLYD